MHKQTPSPLHVLEYPSFIKYMGSKSKIMDFVIEGINEVYKGGPILDLFAGSASLAGAIGQQCAVHSNDIQSYSAVLSETYSMAYQEPSTPTAKELISKAGKIVSQNKIDSLMVNYDSTSSLQSFHKTEKIHKELINAGFKNRWHLFVKYYSGTWWSYEQCLWIDALRQVANRYKNTPCYSVILSSLMFAMAYTSQGTGHYAQYRDAKTASSLKDILIYRKRSLPNYFARKYDEATMWLPKTKPKLSHKTTALDFKECLDQFNGGTVYADPPYCFVHYSRFYHTLETLVLYDFPSIQEKGGEIVKGRYRDNRHQSPFCIKTQVMRAFYDLFQGVEKSGSNLAMSYSNTGMVTINDIERAALEVFRGRTIELLFTDHQHMTLGRQKDRHRDVKECLIIVK